MRKTIEETHRLLYETNHLLDYGFAEVTTNTELNEKILLLNTLLENLEISFQDIINPIYDEVIKTSLVMLKIFIEIAVTNVALAQDRTCLSPKLEEKVTNAG